MNSEDSGELKLAMEWLRETAIEHMEYRRFATLQCRRKLFGVRLDIEVFYMDQGVNVLINFGHPERGVDGVEGVAEDRTVEGMDEWGELVAEAFYSGVLNLLGHGRFVMERDSVAIDEASGRAAGSAGSQRL